MSPLVWSEKTPFPSACAWWSPWGQAPLLGEQFGTSTPPQRHQSGCFSPRGSWGGGPSNEAIILHHLWSWKLQTPGLLGGWRGEEAAQAPVGFPGRRQGTLGGAWPPPVLCQALSPTARSQPLLSPAVKWGHGSPRWSNPTGGGRAAMTVTPTSVITMLAPDGV